MTDKQLKMFDLLINLYAHVRRKSGEVACNMVETRSQVARRSPTASCALTNGKRPFLNADGRSPEGRLLRDREHELAAPLGGIDKLGLSDRLKVEAIALLSVRLELARSELARGEGSTTAEDLVRIANALSRELATLEAIAAERNAPPPAPSLAERIEARRAAQAATA